MTHAMTWFNEPADWSAEGGRLRWQVAPGTDFWRITHYGFTRDNGHLYSHEQAGDFRADVIVTGHYQHQYDQAGLMLRLDERNWIKTGIEYVDSRQHVSAVVTRDYSDWSVAPQAYRSPTPLWLRLTRQGDFVQIDYAFDGQTYHLLRLAYFPPDVPVRIGPMAAAPDGPGFAVQFEQFSVQALPRQGASQQNTGSGTY